MHLYQWKKKEWVYLERNTTEKIELVASGYGKKLEIDMQRTENWKMSKSFAYSEFLQRKD